jgi:hypothetical protein
MATGPAARSLEQFYGDYSRYVDTFLARRSVLDSTLFPEKPAQMFFGYQVMADVFDDLVPWLNERFDGAAFGAASRGMGKGIVPVGITGSMWVYMFGLLGRIFEGREWSRERAIEVLSYWRAGFETYLERSTPAGGAFPESGGRQFEIRLLTPREVAAAETHLDPRAAAAAPPFVAAAANYSWLTEAESRQGTGAHGLYDVEGGKLLVREFVNLSADAYPWIDQSVADLPHGPVSILLRLDGVDADFDAMGVPRLEPQDYTDHITGAAVLTADGFVPDPAEWLRTMRANLGRAHRAAFRLIAGWSPRERFIAGARSYAVMWFPIVRLAGGDEADVQRLIVDRLDEAIDRKLDEHLARDGVAPVWEWASKPDRPTIFTPVLEELR